MSVFVSRLTQLSSKIYVDISGTEKQRKEKALIDTAHENV
jgi:hypothetical protein